MAGIGFELNKLFRRNSFFSDVYALFYSANVVAGPWIMSSATLLLLQFLLPRATSAFLTSALVYTFIFSTIIYGGFATSVVRYLSDLVYRKEYGKIYPLYISTVGHAWLFVGLFLAVFLLLNFPIAPIRLLLFAQSMVLLTLIWVQLSFMTTIQKFSPIVLGFLLGSSTSLLLAVVLHATYGEEAAYFGYNVGLTLIGAVLGTALKRTLDRGTASPEGEHGKQRERRSNRPNLFLEAVRTYRIQALTGFLNYSAAWVDDFFAWAHFRHTPVKGFVFAPEYDFPMFAAYTFIIPTLVLFVTNLETDFYESYRIFYRSIEENKPLNFIVASKRTLDEHVRSATRVIFATQLSFMLVGLTASEALIKLLGLTNYSLRALRAGLVGAAANGLFLFFSLLAYYFDLPKIPLTGASLAFILNASVTPFTLRSLPGIGFAIGFVCASVYCYVAFNKIYADMLRFEFNRTKLNLPRREVVIHEPREERP